VRLDTWREHPEARAELLAQAECLPVEVGERLIDNAENAVEDVLDAPHSWPKVRYWVEPPTLRRRTLKPFRITVVYYVANEEVRVIAYAHEAREPGYWRHRINDWPQ
jgi:plasmid stabilization system protein ParE